MQVSLHRNARTTPAIRRELHPLSEQTKVRDRRYNRSPITVRNWLEREDTRDASDRPHTLHANLTPPQEIVVVELRKLLLLGDRRAVTQEFINDTVTRSGLDRWPRPHGVSRLADPVPREEPATAAVNLFKDYVPGHLHVDVKYLPQMPDQLERKYLFVGIDRATRWVSAELLANKSAQHRSGCLKRLHQAAHVKVTKVLPDHGKEFSDRFCATGERTPTGQHAFDQGCTEHANEHRLIKPRHTQTNGMVERLTGRISAVLKTTRFRSGEHLRDILTPYVEAYDQFIPQRALNHSAPIAALKQCHREHAERFNKKPYSFPGLDT